MILEFSFENRSSSLTYEKLFLEALKEHNLTGNIRRDGFSLKLYVQAQNSEIIELFISDFTSFLPHSIFLYESNAQIVEEMPSDAYVLPKIQKLSHSFCPKCLREVMDSESANYYNIFTQCSACGYGLRGNNRSYKQEFEKIAIDIQAGKKIKINTFYGTYFIGIPDEICNTVPFDIVAYDLITIQKYANVEEYEINALGSFEKPLIRLKKKIKFTTTYEEVEADLLRFKLPDDFILHLLMQELHTRGVDVIFITKEKIVIQKELILLRPEEDLEPIEVVASQKAVAIVCGEKGLAEFSMHSESVVPQVGSFYSVIKEHNLSDENIVGINLSKEYKNNILVYGKKYGLVEYLSLNFEFDSMEDIFKRIVSADENGVKIVQNYKNSCPQHFEKISRIVFKDKNFNIYKLWGIVAIVLNFAKTDNPREAAKILEDNALMFLGTKGPRIDYKLFSLDKKVYLDPLMTIRTAMSFQLAGVDQLTLCYGVIESFTEFIANELDDIKQNMSTTAVVVTGSLLGNRHLFSKMSREISVNHPIYFNNELPIDGRNMFYGGNELEIQ